MHILFVCTGNICRSPIAERLTLAYASEKGLASLTASSAGTRAVIGHPIHHHAAQVLADLGGESEGFVARQLKPKLITDADLVLTMTVAHRDAALGAVPRYLNRTFTLYEASRLIFDFGATTIADLTELRPKLASSQIGDVQDPMGKSPEIFGQVGRTISSLLRPILRIRAS